MITIYIIIAMAAAPYLFFKNKSNKFFAKSVTAVGGAAIWPLYLVFIALADGEVM